METRVDRLRQALELIEPVVPKKATLPVLTNVLVSEGRVIANDLEVCIAANFPEADGEFLLPFRSVLELLKSVPGDEKLSVTREEKMLNLAWAGGKASYPVPEPEDYPSFPDIETMVARSIEGDALVAALNAVVKYCASDSTRPVLQGVAFYFGKVLVVAAADGFRMAYREIPVSFEVEGIEHAILPRKAVALLEHLWKKTPRTPTGDSIVEIATSKRDLFLAVSQDKLMINLGQATMIVKLIEGTPPNFKQLLPKESAVEIKVMAPELERALLRVRNAASDGKDIVRLTWSKESMTVSATGAERGEVETTVRIDSSADGKFAMDIKYILEYLKGKDGMVIMAVNDPQSPALFRYARAPLVVIMPMFVEWGQKPESEVEEEGETEAEVEEEAEAVEAEVIPSAEAEEKPKRSRKRTK